jgi:uncharacterized repeat protein (TIGR03899 family)
MSEHEKKEQKSIIMPQTGENNQQGLDSDTVIVVDTPLPQNKSSAGSSTQMQLLNLAKHFALDGAMKPIDKQMPLEDRSKKRERLNQIRKQKNMESIINKALAYCPDNEIANRTDQDWFNSYINLAEDISNPVMQDLWAKILAGEVAQPNTYSLKALKVFRTMSISDAKLLAKACALAVKDQTRKNIRILSGFYQKPGIFNFFNKNRIQNINLSHFGLSHTDLLSLADNHLVFIQESESLLNKGDPLHFTYNGITLNLAVKKADTIIRFYKFTPIGVELAHLINDKPDNAFFSALKHQLSSSFSVTNS